MFPSSLELVGFKVIGVLLLLPRNERKVVFTVGIALAKLGPILEKYLQNLSATSTGSVILLPSDLNGCLENEDRRPKTKDLEKEDPLENEDLEKEDPLENEDLEKEDPLENEDLENEGPVENEDLENEDP